MAYSEELEKRLTAAIASLPETLREAISKKKMFGGLAFLYKGKMTVGIVKEDLMCRVEASKMEDVLAKESVRPMDFTNRPLKEFVYVSAAGFQTEEQLQQWLELGIAHARDALNEKN